ncbi:MAG TPA: hypothetical protein VKY73_09910 [Polyangiaceae bacterium]|nr:hypothetical protein [Polyangiaceae bacterium]
MPFKTIAIPLLTGGAVAAAAFMLAASRRSDAARVLRDPEGGLRFELDPIAHDETVERALGISSGRSGLKMRTEAEVMAMVGAVWPVLSERRVAENRRSASDALLFASTEDLDGAPSPHEVSSLVGPHAIAPDDDSVGEPLVDEDVIEVPIGHTADRAYDDQLQQDKLHQPDTTGAVLKASVETAESAKIEIPAKGSDVAVDPTFSEPDAVLEERATVGFLEEQDDVVEPYDAVEPEELGTEWITRATEAPPVPDPRLREESAEVSQEIDPVLSDASNNVAHIPNDDEVIAAVEPDELSDEGEVPKEVWDAGVLSERKKS